MMDTHSTQCKSQQCQLCPELSNQLADLVCHRVATGKRCYWVVEREKTSVAASKGLTDASAPHILSPLPTRQVSE